MLARLATLGILLGLGLFLGIVVTAFAVKGYTTDPVEWPYFAIRTALGEQTFQPPDVSERLQEPVLRLLGTAALLVGGGLLAVVFGLFAAWATKRRLDPEAGAQSLAKHLRGHVIVAGLGQHGYRLAGLLHGAKIGCVFLSPSREDPYADATEAHAPVLFGDITLQENLERANVRQALAVVGCSTEPLANVESCMRAERLARETGRPLRTVVRVFQDGSASQAALGFGLKAPVSAADLASPSFVAAALGGGEGEEFGLDGLRLIGARHILAADLQPGALESWRQRGLAFVASRSVAAGGSTAVDDPPPDKAPAKGEELLLFGPPETVQAFREEFAPVPARSASDASAAQG